MILQHLGTSTWPGLLTWALQGTQVCASSSHPQAKPTAQSKRLTPSHSIFYNLSPSRGPA